MRSPVSSALVVVVLMAGSISVAGAQSASPPDHVLAARGHRAWETRQCSGCHELGRKQATGPDLIGVTDRRSTEWIRAWLKNPLAPDDSTARALRAQYGSQMPNLHLNNDEVEGLIVYLAQQTQLRAKK